jgi:hypothetical protein
MMNRMPKLLGGWAGSATVNATVLAAWVAVVSGCGGGSSTPVTEESYCQDKAAKECQVAAKCGTDMTACKNQRNTICLAVNAASRSATRFFTAGNVSACVNQTNTVYAKANTSAATQADIDNMNDICGYVFQGMAASGAACTSKYDCKNKNQICDTKNGTALCSDKVTKNKGQPCGNHGEVCSSDSYCLMDSTGSYTCTAKAAQGAPCSAAIPCVDPYRCDSVTATCVTKLAAGALCNSSADCLPAAPFCDQYIQCKCDLGLSFAAGALTCADYGGSPNGNTPPCGAGSSPDAGTTSNTDASSGG